MKKLFVLFVILMLLFNEFEGKLTNKVWDDIKRIRKDRGPVNPVGEKVDKTAEVNIAKVPILKNKAALEKLEEIKKNLDDRLKKQAQNRGRKKRISATGAANGLTGMVQGVDIFATCNRAVTGAMPKAFCWRKSRTKGDLQCPPGLEWDDGHTFCRCPKLQSSCPQGFNFDGLCVCNKPDSTCTKCGATLVNPSCGGGGCPPGTDYSDGLCLCYNYAKSCVLCGGVNTCPNCNVVYMNSLRCPPGWVDSVDGGGALTCVTDCNATSSKFSCGVGACASSQGSCASAITDMVASIFTSIASIAILILTAGAGSGATQGISASQAGVRAALQSSKEFLIQAFKKMGKQFFKDLVIDQLKSIGISTASHFLVTSICGSYAEKVYGRYTDDTLTGSLTGDNIVGALTLGATEAVKNCSGNDATGCAQSILGVVANFDPTGLVGVAASFVYSQCENAS